MISADKMITNPYKKSLQERQAKGKEVLHKQLDLKAREMEDMLLAARKMKDLYTIRIIKISLIIQTQLISGR
jgi:hypothetical protein